MIHVADLDLLDRESRLPAVAGELLVIVWAGAEPLGETYVQRYSPLWEQTTRTDIVYSFKERLYALQEVRPKSEPEPAPPGSVSIVVAARDERALPGCLRAVSALAPPPGEVVVVGGARETAAAAGLGFGSVEEPTPALGRRRNAGWRAARGKLVAFLTDTARPHPRYVAALGRAFAAPQVTGVFGLVVPAELDGYPQTAFERHLGGLNKGYARELFHRSAWPASPGTLLGTGTNLALRRAALEALGGFDESPGPGAALGSGDDLDLLARLLGTDGVLAYEPAALVRHVHPRTRDELLLYVRAEAAALAVFRTRQAGARAAMTAAIRGDVRRLAQAIRAGRRLHVQMVLARLAGARDGIRHAMAGS